MAKKKQEITMKCDKCGEQPPINEEKSNENWTVFKTSEPCECGGDFHLDFGNLI